MCCLQAKEAERRRRRAVVEDLRISLFEISTVLSSQCYRLFHTVSQLLPAPAEECQPFPRAPHTKPPSPRCRQATKAEEQWTTANALHKKPRWRDVLLGRSLWHKCHGCPYCWSRSRGGFSYRKDPFMGRCEWAQNTGFPVFWVGCFRQRYHFHSCHENEAVIAHMCSSVERFPSSHDKDRWKSLISILFFGYADCSTKLQGAQNCGRKKSWSGFCHGPAVIWLCHCILRRHNQGG